MDETNFFGIRCQIYNHRGGGFVIEISEKDGAFWLHYQTDTHKPRWEKFKDGRIDRKAPFDTLKLTQLQIDQLVAKTSSTQITFTPPLTGGFDGIDHKIWMTNGMTEIHVSWWMDCPTEWQSLHELWQSIVSLKENL